MTQAVNEDIILACADLAGRAGAREFEIGHTGDNDNDPDALWYAHATYQGARIMSGEHATPTAAALALAERLLSGATCRCRQPVTLSDARPGCRWRLIGQRWEPSCDVPSLRVRDGKPGDHAAMRWALAEPPAPANRAERRRNKR